MAPKGNIPEFKTLKECLQFLYWLNDKKQDVAKSRLANRLVRLLNGKYNTVDQPQIEYALSQFLTKVSNFYEKLCKSPQGVYTGERKAKPALNYLLQCIPKVLSVMYFLQYHVDKRFDKVGGGGWEEDQVGMIELTRTGSNLEKYLCDTFTGEHKYGVIPGGFQPAELKEGYKSGYSEGRLLLNLITPILEKEKNEKNLFRDVFSTSVLSTAGSDTSNVANALRLVRDFCGIFEKVEDERDFRNNLESRGRCINWQDLKEHCAKLKTSLDRMFNNKAFSFTGFGRKYEFLDKKNIDKKMAKWLKDNLSRVKQHLDTIDAFDNRQHKVNARLFNSGALKPNDKAKLMGYYRNNFFRYGFTFYGEDVGTGRNRNETMKGNWVDVINELKNESKGLNKLKTILDGTVCQLENEEEDDDADSEPEDVDLVDEEDPLAVKTEATKTEAAKPAAPKPDAVQNQGKKSEGAQNQGKKVEGAQNQGKKSEGGLDPQSSPAAGPGGGSSLGGQGSTSDAGHGIGQDTQKGLGSDTASSTTQGSGSSGDGANGGAGHSGGNVSGGTHNQQTCSGKWVDSWNRRNKMCVSDAYLEKANRLQNLWEDAKKAEVDKQKKQQEEEEEVNRKKTLQEQYRQKEQLQNHILSVEGSIVMPPLEGKVLPDISDLLQRQKEAREILKYQQQIYNMKYGNNVNGRPIKPPKLKNPTIKSPAPPHMLDITGQHIPTAQLEVASPLLTTIQKPKGAPSHPGQQHPPNPVKLDTPSMATFTSVVGAKIENNSNKMITAHVSDDLNVERYLASQLTGVSISNSLQTAQQHSQKVHDMNEQFNEIKNLQKQRRDNEDEKIRSELEKGNSKSQQWKQDGEQMKLGESIKESIVHPNLHPRTLPDVMLYKDTKPYMLPPVIDVGPFDSTDSNNMYDSEHFATDVSDPKSFTDLRIYVPERAHQGDFYDVDLDDPPPPQNVEPLDPLVPATPAINLNFPVVENPPIDPPEDFDKKTIVKPELTMCLAPWATSTPAHDSTDIPETEMFPAEAPRTVRDMLTWLAGLKHEKHQETLKLCIKKAFSGLQDNPSQLALSVNGYHIRTNDVFDILQLTAMFASSVLSTIAPNWKTNLSSRTVNPVSNQSDEPDCCALLCQLRDYVYASHHQLEFLKTQCNRDKLSGGWQNCNYGSDVTPSKSPLQSFLTDGWDCTFDTHLFDPCNLCHKSRIRMGFRGKDLPEKSQLGSVISTILSPSCGGSDHDALLAAN